MALFTWLFISFVGVYGAIFTTCLFIVLATQGERPRWFTALMRRVARRIG